MAISRYKELDVIENDNADYKKLFAKRLSNDKFLAHLETQSLDYPTFKEIKSFDYANHLWSLGDRYYKLAHKYYGDSKYWWVIAFFNKKPTEQHVELGEIIKIPLPLRDVIESFGL
jgi:hypothetical protein